MKTTSGITNAGQERIKDIFIQIFQQILCQVQLFQLIELVEGSVAEAPEAVALQPQAAKIRETVKGTRR